MFKHIRLNRGLDIPIAGAAELNIGKTIIPEMIALKPTDFKRVIPKLDVKEGDVVKAGTIVFHDKNRPEIGFASPCSGTVTEIVRGEKRKLLEIRIKADKENDYIHFDTLDISKASKENITTLLLSSGLWVYIKQRPYGTIANPNDIPKAIFISGFHSSPLAPNVNFTLKDEHKNLQTGVDVLNKLTNGGVHIGLDYNNYSESPLYKLNNVKYYGFSGPHPAGNVGIQIHHINPIQKGEIAWTIDPENVAAIGRLFNNGVYDLQRLIAIAGPRVLKPCYVKGVPGMNIKSISEFINNDTNEIYGQQVGTRYISGDALTGKPINNDGYLGFYDNQITVLSEGNYYELFGWAKPCRPKKFSFSHSYCSWLFPKKKINLDTNLNGGHRAFVVTGLYEKVLPMDIFPVYLLKAILAENIDKMEELGIYEVIEEDLALCEFVCPSKIDVQSIISNGIEIMIKEMA
jgi:NADH:ubiquinone oxidoreductase, Na(+)-translocating, A subunit